MKLTRDEFDNILWGADDYKAVTGEIIEEQDRWHTYFSKVFVHKNTGEFYRAEWGSGSTECQESDHLDWSFTKVKPVEKTVIIYEKFD